MYTFHYVDAAGVDWRFDRHPNTHSPLAQFHPPPDAATAAAEPSCVAVTEVSLVARAVHAMWRTAYEAGDLARLNRASDPPSVVCVVRCDLCRSREHEPWTLTETPHSVERR